MWPHDLHYWFYAHKAFPSIAQPSGLGPRFLWSGGLARMGNCDNSEALDPLKVRWIGVA